MTDYLDRLDRLPPSDKLIAFRDALRAFLIADRPGVFQPSPESWGHARDDKEEAWEGLSCKEKEAVRRCMEGRG